jgi:hypothetical protein
MVPYLETADERIHFIAGLMSENKWPAWPDSVAYRRVLADKWGVSDSSIRSYSAQAHRLIALDPDEREQLRAELAKRMKRIADDAETRENNVTGLPDYGSAIKALDQYAKYSGIELEQKVKLSGSVGIEDIEELRKRIDGE